MSSSPFVIKKMNLFSSWVFNLPKNTECTICRCSLNTNSIYHQEKGLDSHIVDGMCGHSFHYECIKPWVDMNKHCPICSAQWAYRSKPDDSKSAEHVNKKVKQQQ